MYLIYIATLCFKLVRHIVKSNFLIPMVWQWFKTQKPFSHAKKNEERIGLGSKMACEWLTVNDCNWLLHIEQYGDESGSQHIYCMINTSKIK